MYVFLYRGVNNDVIVETCPEDNPGWAQKRIRQLSHVKKVALLKSNVILPVDKLRSDEVILLEAKNRIRAE